MIISHEHRFIFLKTRKTAGTSVEIALSRFCGERDVITAISPEDEKTRQELGYRGPQNTSVPLGSFRLGSWRPWFRVKRTGFYNHVPAEDVRAVLGDEVWSAYFKFSFDRNPFDKAISRYYWSTRKLDERPAIGDYLARAEPRLISNWETYTIDGAVAVDFVGRYENLAEDLEQVRQRIGLAGELALPHAKSGTRKERKHYSEVLDACSRARIEDLCRREMEVLSYRWEDEAGPGGGSAGSPANPSIS